MLELPDDIAGLQRLYRAGEARVGEVVAACLERIRVLDPHLNAMVTLNPTTLHDAARLDASTTEPGPLFGVPIVLKDNIDTARIATASGSAALADRVPAADAHLAARLRQAGAVILGKTAMPDFAMSWHGHSTRSGVTRNPHDLSRDPGGSSSGTAAAVAAGLAMAGVGTDTGGSIRIPASFCGLVGIRPTVGLVSRHGVTALVDEQDTPGPLARSVADAAAVLDAMTGWDPDDPFTALPALQPHPGLPQGRLVPGALRGARIGVLRQLCTTGPGDDPEVARVVDDNLAAMREAGATLLDVELPRLADLLRDTFAYLHQSRRDVNRSLARAGVGVTDLADIVAATPPRAIDALLRAVAASPEDPYHNVAYGRCLERRAQLQRVIAQLFVQHRLSALCYPSARIPAPVRADIDNGAFDTHTPGSRPFPTNTLLAAQAAFPAVTTPVGTTADGLPVGLELLGLPHRDGDLIALAFDLERIAADHATPTLTTHLRGLT
ncbi:amidase [Amycolatopsis pithecellobii]|uniref:amidase n=1 Tax=Amycolatopsis pithecellobii TaxID=664692 RepID=UPI00140991AD|nr:amidase [Amycolatopsis pithecellobii]